MGRDDASHPRAGADAPWPRAVQTVMDYAAKAGVTLDVVRYPEGTRTAEDAARAVGCGVGQIVKSLVFVAGEEPIVALVSGANRADTDALSRLCGGVPVRRASADEVREATGFTIGGVPPFGHRRTLRVFIDRDLAAYGRVWAAAGTPDCVFPIEPHQLARLTGGRWEDIKAASPQQELRGRS